ncbi:MAG: hypothetical protein LKG17_07550 [Megasphaera sp.]|jgi:hypothetical protein|nr:hypothetical protein [Megasphaera sp.]
MKITIECEANEIAALVSELQKQPKEYNLFIPEDSFGKHINKFNPEKAQVNR